MFKHEEEWTDKEESTDKEQSMDEEELTGKKRRVILGICDNISQQIKGQSTPKYTELALVYIRWNKNITQMPH